MMNATLETIKDDFAYLDDWEERYRYLIELGDGLSPFPGEARDATHKVPGCASQVWLKTIRGEGDDPCLDFLGDSDAHIVRGLIAVLFAIYGGKPASRILATDAEDILRSLGLDEHLTPQRSNGLRSMVARIRQEARTALEPPAS